ncbi:hypothetical protein [Candidatus Methylomicrobium oryzae]|jgi:hypothetical protein|uniref:hypothetical protein n=1 Tax=Candidatus Methylomicrobium oryzae TaxID=2802053 RepID=UPI001923BF59|nr:hypothetical protein [Methylomicrobium sp. RS1]MBL1262689.1 hypothetical protein [Methylomicrobium sp. RS1]
MFKIMSTLLMVSAISFSSYAATEGAASKHEETAKAREEVVKHPKATAEHHKAGKHEEVKKHVENAGKASETAHTKPKEAAEHSAK